MQDPEDRDNGCEMWSYRHGLVAVIMSLQQLCLRAMDLDQIGLATNQSGMWKVLSYPLLLNYFVLLLDSDKRVVIVFSCALTLEPVFNGLHQIHRHMN